MPSTSSRLSRCESRVRESAGRALEDLTEASAAQVQVADDQWRPALGKDLGATGDGAVLTVRPHDASVAYLPSVVESSFLTSRRGLGGPMGAMKRPSTASSPPARRRPAIPGRLIAATPTATTHTAPSGLEPHRRPPPATDRPMQRAADVAGCGYSDRRDHDLEIAIRGGGHNVPAGTAVCDYGIVIDVSAMPAVRAIPPAQGLGAGWRAVGRRRPRDAGARWPPRRNGQSHRSRRAHRRRWRRLADAQARPLGRS